MREKGKNRNKKSFWRRIRFKYKLSVINEGTLEEVWTFRLSQLSAFALLDDPDPKLFAGLFGCRGA